MSPAAVENNDNGVQWFSRWKTRAPKIQVDLVERARLLVPLQEALEKPLSCVVAPAGFGKSTLLSQWRDLLVKRGVPCAWVNLDEGDREARQFVAYMVFAFENAGVKLGSLSSLAEQGFGNMSSVAVSASLFKALAEINKKVVLILDDYHLAASDEVNQLVRQMADQFSDFIHIAIGSRASLDVGLVELMVAGRAVEVSASMLRFSDREVEKAIGDTSSKSNVTALQSRVEGWPVAIQMAKLLDPESIRKNKVYGLSQRSTTHIGEYLASNVLAAQSRELQSFLLETSVLSKFNGKMVDAIRDRDDSASLIRKLGHLQALIVPLDEDSEWYRYHHLFSSCLSASLETTDPSKLRILKQRAATWCAEQKLITEAVSYAASIGDYELCRTIIVDNCDWMRAAKFGGAGYLRNVFSRLPDQELYANARVLYMKAYVLVSLGEFREARNLVQAADARIQQEGPSPGTLKDQIEVGTSVLCRVEHQMERGGGWLSARLKLVDELRKTIPQAYIVSGVIRIALAGQSLGYGAFDEARDHAQAAHSDLEKVSSAINVSYLEVIWGLISFSEGAPIRAREHFRRAIANADEFAAENSNMKYVGEVLLLVSQYWETGSDHQLVQKLEEAIDSALGSGGWYEIYALGFDAVVHNFLNAGDNAHADKVIERLESSTYRLAIERLHQFAQVLRLRYFLAIKSYTKAAEIFGNCERWLDVDEQKLDNMGWLHRFMVYDVCARYLILADQYQDALKYADRSQTEAMNNGVPMLKVRSDILKGSILQALRDDEGAVGALKDAIIAAAPISCVRPFIVEAQSDMIELAAQELKGEAQAPDVIELISAVSKDLVPSQFSTRDLEILKLLAAGKSNKEIAREFDVSDNTVKFHLKTLFKRLGVRNRVNAVEQARKLNLI